MLRKQLGDLARRVVDDAVLVKLMLLEYSRPELFDQLYEWQLVSDGKPAELVRLETAARTPGSETIRTDDEGPELAAWNESAVQQWLQMAPPLSGVDLGDYFWVARDRISSNPEIVAK